MQISIHVILHYLGSLINTSVLFHRLYILLLIADVCLILTADTLTAAHAIFQTQNVSLINTSLF